MRAVVQRVTEAEVAVGGAAVGRIGCGLLVYVGVAVEDGPAEADFLANKIRYLRIFPDDAGRMNLDVVQAQGAVLLVSNFTLCADTRQGRRPAFTGAADPTRADELYRLVAGRLTELGLKVELGRFGEEMRVSSVNDGPVNVVIDTGEAKTPGGHDSGKNARHSRLALV